jgi:hypothetical protein
VSARGRRPLTYGAAADQLAFAGVSSAVDYGGAEFYPTPAAPVHALLAAIDAGYGAPLPNGIWYEPAVGEGAIIRAVEAVKPGLTWAASDIRTTNAAQSLYRELRGQFIYHVGDFLAATLDRTPWIPEHVAVCITNPPFSLAENFARRAIEITTRQSDGNVLMLLPLAFLETPGRSVFHREHPSDIYPLARRPSFTGGGTDARPYGWFRWSPDGGGRWYPPIRSGA